VVKNCSRAELEPVIKGQVLSKTTVYTEGWLGYDGLLLSGYKHRRIHHHENEFARGKNHVNGIESFWSYTKFRFLKLRGVRREFFFLHLKESEWRWNHRRDNLYFLLLKTSAENRSNLGKTLNNTGIKAEGFKDWLKNSSNIS
jgi:transposase-like protein